MDEKKMKWTGERYTPGSIDGDITVEHLHRYYFAKKIISNKDLVVVDIASGEGYGTYILSKEAKFAYGIDISEDAINFAKEKYIKNNLEYKLGNCSNIPLQDKSVDVVVSFETIEHHDKHEEMLSEIKRILKDDGILIISSPDKKNYTELSKGENHYHIKELFFEEFKNLLSSRFKHIQFFGQKLTAGSFLGTNDENLNSFAKLENESNISEFDWHQTSIYHLAVASNHQLKQISNSFLESNWLHHKIYELTVSGFDLERRNSELIEEITKIKRSIGFRVLKKLKLLT